MGATWLRFAFFPFPSFFFPAYTVVSSTHSYIHYPSTRFSATRHALPPTNHGAAEDAK